MADDPVIPHSGRQHERFGGKLGDAWTRLKLLADGALPETPPAIDDEAGHLAFISPKVSGKVVWLVRLGEGLDTIDIKIGRWAVLTGKGGEATAEFVPDPEGEFEDRETTLIYEQDTYGDRVGCFITGKAGTATTPVIVAFKTLD